MGLSLAITTSRVMVTSRCTMGFAAADARALAVMRSLLLLLGGSLQLPQAGGEATAEAPATAESEPAQEKAKPARAKREKGGGRTDTRGKGAKTSTPRKAGGS